MTITGFLIRNHGESRRRRYLNGRFCRMVQRGQGSWCKLGQVELEHESFDGMKGVYVIWHDPEKPVVLRVGEGPIRTRLAQERSDQRLSAYRLDSLFVTWAPVNAIDRTDVARYLADTLTPTFGDRYPGGNQIEVNLPCFSDQTSSVS